jgi:alpha-amylase
MSTLTICFRVHIPLQLRMHEQDNIGILPGYFDAEADRALVGQWADACYLPANKIMAEAIERNNGDFKLSYSISGTTLELLQAYRPDVIASFQQLVATGCVELLAETYYNSLSWLYAKASFRQQVMLHTNRIRELFDYDPTVFRNTGLVYDNTLAKYMASMGYSGILCEGVNTILQGRTANQLYAAPGNGDFGVLLRNAELSDDIAFRFDDPEWNEQPLTAGKYASWIHTHGADCNINLFLDYETFGIYKKAASGIFEFLEHLPTELLSDSTWRFSTPAEILNNSYPKDIYDTPTTISWKGKEMEYCIWCENMMQNNMLKKIYSIENMVLGSGCKTTLHQWGQLQAADHFYQMAETVHRSNAGAAYRNYVNIITDFEIKLIRKGLSAFDRKQHTGNPTIY